MNEFKNDPTTFADDYALIITKVAPFILAGIGIFGICNLHRLPSDLQSEGVIAIAGIATAGVSKGGGKNDS